MVWMLAQPLALMLALMLAHALAHALARVLSSCQHYCRKPRDARGLAAPLARACRPRRQSAESAQGRKTRTRSNRSRGSFGVRRLDGQAEADRQRLGQATPTRPPTHVLYLAGWMQRGN